MHVVYHAQQIETKFTWCVLQGISIGATTTYARYSVSLTLLTIFSQRIQTESLRGVGRLNREVKEQHETNGKTAFQSIHECYILTDASTIPNFLAKEVDFLPYTIFHSEHYSSFHQAERPELKD